MTPRAFVLHALGLAGLLLAVPLVAAEPPYLSAGVGDDDPLLSVIGDYNLKLVFAVQGSGEYLADVRVRVSDASDRPLLETVSPGPMFYVRLAPGRYRIVAEFEGRAQGKSVTLVERRLQSLNFYWPSADASDTH